MRLTEKEKTTIRITAQKFDPNAKVYLYGSRANDALKGGDIDLIIVSETLTFSEKLSILVELKLILGEQKIDLMIANSAKLNSDAFVKSVMGSAILL